MISHVVPNDEHTGFNYVCQLRNNVLLTESGGSKHQVIVKGNTVLLLL